MFQLCLMLFAIMFDVLLRMVFDAAAIMYVWMHVRNLVASYTYHWLPPTASAITCYPLLLAFS